MHVALMRKILKQLLGIECKVEFEVQKSTPDRSDNLGPLIEQGTVRQF